MRSGGGGEKGHEFERKVCKDLSLWVSGGTREDLFWRSSMSGGRATVHRKRGVLNLSQVGDISAVAREGHWLTDRFAIECKSYKVLGIDSSLFKGKGLLLAFWNEIRGKAAYVGKQPLLIAKQNLFPVFLVTSWVGVSQLGIRYLIHFRVVSWDACFILYDSVLESEKPWQQ